MTMYVWFILSVLLVAGEVAVPGFFLLWIGIGAAAVGVVVSVATGLGLLVQSVLFALFAFLSCFAYAKWIRPSLEKTPMGSEHLNHRGARMVGQCYRLTEAIINGRGKAEVGDGQWLVTGPDLPVGTLVEVVALDGTTLQVRIPVLIQPSPPAQAVA